MTLRASTQLIVAVFGLTVLLLVLSACGAQEGAAPRPPEIYYGEDICEFCGMIISEERYAAAYLTEDGREHIFDDISGMVQAHLQAQAGPPVTAFFVHDYEDGRWIRAETAHYVLSEDLPTPMLSGLAALATIEQAEALAAERDGQLLTFEELLSHYQQAASMEGMEHQH